MQIETETREGKTLLTLKEERLDAANSGEVREIILSLLEKGGSSWWWISPRSISLTARDLARSCRDIKALTFDPVHSSSQG